MDKSKPGIESFQVNDHQEAQRTNSSAAVPCGMPKWLTRITGQHQNNNATMSTSQARSLGSSFSDPTLIGVGCTPPRSSHFIIVGSNSDGKTTATIVENNSSDNYDIRRPSSSSTLMLQKSQLGISYSASNSPITRRRDLSVMSGSGKRTWNGGSGNNNLNFVEAFSPSADSDFYHHIRGSERRRSSFVRENVPINNATNNDVQAPFRGEETFNDGLKSSRFGKEHQFTDLKDLNHKLAKVIPTRAAEFPVATKESLDGLKKGALKDTEDDLFDMDEHPTSLEDNKHQSNTFKLEISHKYEGKSEEVAKMTLTQTILEKGMPQNWFFQDSQAKGGETRHGDLDIPQNNIHGSRYKNGTSGGGNRTQMRELNVWAPQNL